MKLVLAFALAAAAAASPSSADVCARHATDAMQGCCPFCGYEPVTAGDDVLCMPAARGELPQLPFAIGAADDRAEYCALVAATHGCNEACGFTWNGSRCTRALGGAPAVPAAAAAGADPIIGGQGKFRYQYMPDLLQAPAGASLVNCHGLVTDKDKNIYLTYQNDGKDQNCLIRWNPDGTGGEFMSGSGNTTALCTGTPHGLKITSEPDGKQYLYHANNNAKLTKTTLDGSVVWQVNGFFGQNTTEYRPTWFATPPDSKYTYLCDGYGSNNVYAFDRTTGTFMNRTWGGHSPGKSPTQPHGTFSTNHGCTYDPRQPENHTIIVSDRANSRFEFFRYNPDSFDTFEWWHTVDFEAQMGAGTLPCNIRMYPEQEGRAIVPDLAGPVAVLDAQNEVVSVVNVSVLLAAQQHKHPHDAIFLPNGDMVVATWAPGRVSYWKLLPAEEDSQDKSCTPDANCDGTGGFNCKQCGDSSLPAWSCKSGACCDGHTETSYAGGVICK